VVVDDFRVLLDFHGRVVGLEFVVDPSSIACLELAAKDSSKAICFRQQRTNRPLGRKTNGPGVQAGDDPYLTQQVRSKRFAAGPLARGNEISWP